MVKRGHQVDVTTYMGHDVSFYDIDGVNVRTLNPASFDADIIISHLGDDQTTSVGARAAGVPSVRMVHGIPLPGQALDDDLAVFNSVSLAEHVGWSGPSIVVHPPTDLAAVKVKPGRRVTLVNLTPDKGGILFWQLVKRSPAVQFLGVHGDYGEQVSNKAKNALIINPTADMANDVYAHTGVLLMPSLHETWGRVGLEAMASGIPVIAHPTPGLSESLGDAATFIDRDDVDAWHAEIMRLQGHSTWLEASVRASEHAARFDHRPGLARFCGALEDLA